MAFTGGSTTVIVIVITITINYCNCIVIIENDTAYEKQLILLYIRLTMKNMIDREHSINSQ